MWFRNLVLYRLPAGWSLSAAQLEEKLGTRPLQPCGALEMLSRGWVAPCASGRLVHALNQHHLIALGVEQKLLPAAIIRQEALRRAKLKEDSQGFPVGKRQMRDLKLRVTEELRRPGAQSPAQHACLDRPAGRLVRGGCGKSRQGRGTDRDAARHAGQLRRAVRADPALGAHQHGRVADAWQRPGTASRWTRI